MTKLTHLALAGLLTAMLLATAPAVTAQETCPDGQVESPEGCSDQAWVDDCPPDMLCAADAEDTQAYGDEDCIDCMRPPGDGGDPSTCMDGAQGNETCDPDVYYMDDPSRGPSDGSCEFCRGDADDGQGNLDDEVSGGEGAEADAEADRKDTPFLGPALMLAGLALAVLAFATARRE